MSCLTYSISFDKWESVLKEVYRVLTVGGRLELIDDHIFFAYGKPPLSPSSSGGTASPPVLDIPIPSPRMSTFSSASGRFYRGKEDEAERADLYALYEEDAETETLSGVPRASSPGVQSMDTYNRRGSSSFPPFAPIPSPMSPTAASMIMSTYTDPWTESAAAARDLESLFEHMLNMKYGIHLCPSEFVLDMILRIFGHSREVETMHLTLAPPDQVGSNGSPDERENLSSSSEEGAAVATRSTSKSPPGRATDRSVSAARVDQSSRSSSVSTSSYEAANPLLNSPGLVLWPSTFIPLPKNEVEAHALKHNRVLLSCKGALAEYAKEINEDEDWEDEGVMEALWDYEK